MPKERFLRLPEEKREMIWRAAAAEFKRVPPEEVSINRIVRDADISRGSFYTYFTDKEDLLRWLIGDSMEINNRAMRESLLNNGGDIWAMMLETFDITLDQALSGGFLEIVKNLIGSSSFSRYFREGLENFDAPDKYIGGERIWFYEHMDKRSCPLSQREFGYLMDLWQGALTLGLKAVLMEKKTRESAAEKYRSYIHILKYGAGSAGELCGG